MKLIAIIRQISSADGQDFDRSGVEAALRLKNQSGGFVTVICPGDENAVPVLKEALAMGCDDAFLISTSQAGDPAFSAFVLAETLKDCEFDVIFTGCHGVDADAIQIGFLLAERLKLPEAGFVTEVSETEQGQLLVKRQFEDQTQTLSLPSPCLISAILQPRHRIYPTMDGITRAYSKAIPCRPIRTFTAAETASLPRPCLLYSAKETAAGNKTLLDIPAQEAVSAILHTMITYHIL